MRISIISALALCVSATAFGCTSETTDTQEQAQNQKLGHMDVALVGRGSQGNLYVLREATVMVQGPSSTEFYNTEDDPTRMTLSSDVPPGQYTVFLQEGWRLERVTFDGGGTGYDAGTPSGDAGSWDEGGGTSGGTTGATGADVEADAGIIYVDGGAGGTGGGTGGTGGTGGGYTLTPVEAQLTSANPQLFQVFENQRTQAALRFQVGDEVVGMEGGYDITLEVDETPSQPNTEYCSADADCATGETCCLSGFLGTCRTLNEGESCPLPDLTVSTETAQSSLYIHHENFDANSCALAEGCVAGPGDRRLLAFSTQTPNVGQADMILGDPTNVPGFEFSSCHGHYHFEGYAAYQLLDQGGNVVATGHKQAFCLLDSTQVVPGSSNSPRYHCGFQGIQAGWSDVYGAGLDCQWVDITGVAEGDYVLAISINPDHTLPEANYDNNTATIPVHIGADLPPVPGDVLSPCPAGNAGALRDCGFEAPEAMQAVACEPGANVVVGCGCAGLGSCVGDPVLRICEGDAACLASEAIVSVDDACGLCPQTSFVCPASGVYSVLTGAYGPGSAYTCEPAAQ